MRRSWKMKWNRPKCELVISKAKLEALERQRNIIPDIEAKFSGLNRGL